MQNSIDRILELLGDRGNNRNEAIEIVWLRLLTFL